LYIGFGLEIPGGIATLARSIIAVLGRWAAEDYGRTVDVALMAGDRKREASLCEDVAHPVLSIKRYHGSRMRLVAALAARIPGHTYDVLLCEHVNLMTIAALLPARSLICIVYSGDIWNEISRSRRFALKRADKLLAVSHFAAQRALDKHPWLPNLEVCYPGIAIPKAPASIGHAGHRREILAVSRMSQGEPGKNLGMLLKAMSQVLPTVPEARLVMVGDGDDQHRLKAEAAALGISESVEFTGFIDEQRLHEQYCRASVFALPSAQEGFGLVYLEAMARGIPVIGCNWGPSSEIIDHGKTGFLIPPGDACTLAHNIVLILNDRQMALEMGEAGRHKFLSHFTEQHFAQRLRAALALDSRPRTRASSISE
jgi:phosphatidylinositol alpha-1,6-mannosyltransferase